MTLKQATSRRLTDIRATFESEHTEHTGRLRYHTGTRDVAGRIGGVKRMYPETERLKQSPKVIAAAIRRGKGKVFRQVYGVVEGAMLKEGFKASRAASGVRSVDPHKGKRYCIHCRQQHTKGQHRFHGPGSFQSTHLFSFNPRMKKNAKEFVIPAGWEKEYERYERWKTEDLKREYLELMKASFDKVFGHNARNAQKIVGRILRERGYYWIENALGDIPIKENRPMRRTARRNPQRSTVIYGRVLRIEAQKTQKHLCDAACKKAGHRYYHDFKVSPVMYGLPDGSILIKK